MRVELTEDVEGFGEKKERIEIEDVPTAERMIKDGLAKEVK